MAGADLIQDKLNVIEDEFIDAHMPRPNAVDLREIFIAIINQFVRETKIKRLNPKSPIASMDKNMLIARLCEVLGLGDATVRAKLKTLASLGWVRISFGYVENPVVTYAEALQYNKAHPGREAL